MHLEMSGVKDIGSQASMVLLNYQNFIAMTSNMIYTVALGVGFKCPRKIHLYTQCTEMIFASLLSGGFTTTMAVINPISSQNKRTVELDLITYDEPYCLGSAV